MRRILCGLSSLLTLTLMGSFAIAADHRDGPAAIADASTDINDVYTFMNPTNPTDGEADAEDDEVIFIVTFATLATAETRPSDAAEYRFNLTNVSAAEAVLGDDVESFTISCTYTGDLNDDDDLDDADEDVVTCSDGSGDGSILGDDLTVDFNAADPEGDVGWRVWAGLRDDPFFFDLDAFNATAAGEGDGWFDDADGDDEPNWFDDDFAKVNFFAGRNTLAIVVGVDRNLINEGGDSPVVRVWASTHQAE